MQHDTPQPIQTPEQLVEELAPLVRLLNGLMSEDLQWQTTRGRKEHIDVFGRIVPEGSVHYRQGGTTWGDCNRLSLESMDGVLTVLLSSHYTLNLAKTAASERTELLRALGQALRSPRDGNSHPPEGGNSQPPTI